MSRRYTAIPTYLGTPASLAKVLEALKHAVELLAGLRGGAPAPRVYIQEIAPTDMQASDFWWKPSTKKLAIYDGNLWEAVN